MLELQERHEPGPAERAWSQLLDEHATLGTRAERLEDLLACIAEGEPPPTGWTALQEQVDAFRVELIEHLAREERDGVLEAAVAVQPRFARRMARLRQEHMDLRSRIEGITQRCTESPGRRDWAAVHTRFVAFRMILGDHERAENDILQSAYLEDLGGRG
ncbi:MAG: hemerythrin domain-containing protein [Myxococcota bacterium]